LEQVRQPPPPILALTSWTFLYASCDRYFCSSSFLKFERKKKAFFFTPTPTPTPTAQNLKSLRYQHYSKN
jgi:hypothetical protein